MISAAGFANVDLPQPDRRRRGHSFRLAHLMFQSLVHMAQAAPGRAARSPATTCCCSREQLADLPWPARLGVKLMRFGTGSPATDPQSRLTAALSALGPSYIKLGQFLATRPDIVGPAARLRTQGAAGPPAALSAWTRQGRSSRANLGPVDTLFTELRPPVAAASIAQVHKAVPPTAALVAVKVLRPGVEKRFAADLQSFYFAARLLERFSAEGRRLRPVAAVAMLEAIDEAGTRPAHGSIRHVGDGREHQGRSWLPRASVDWERTRAPGADHRAGSTARRSPMSRPCRPRAST